MCTLWGTVPFGLAFNGASSKGIPMAGMLCDAPTPLAVALQQLQACQQLLRAARPSDPAAPLLLLNTNPGLAPQHAPALPAAPQAPLPPCR